MSFFEFPHTRTYDNDLGWLIRHVKMVEDAVETFIALNSIKYADPIEWNIATQYEKNTVVVDPLDGTAYLSNGPVPAGILLSNTDYWTPIFNYEGSINDLREEIYPANEGKSDTAVYYHNEGDIFWWKNKLYKALFAFPPGTAFIEGTNIEHITVEDILRGKLETADTVDNMKSHDLFPGQYCATGGYYEYGDGGGALYRIQAAQPDVYSEQLDNGNYAVPVLGSEINILVYGAKMGDTSAASRNVISFRAAVADCKDKYKAIYIPIGRLYLNESIGIGFSLKIRGEHTANNHYNYLITDYVSMDYASAIVDLRGNLSPQDFLFECYTQNTGCFELQDLYIDGNGGQASGINLRQAGWTCVFQNVTIDHFMYEGLRLNGQYDSNFTNLTIERCGRIKYNGNAVYALHIMDTETYSNSNAIHFTNFHIEFCRYFIHFERSQDIVFVNSKIEVMRWVDDENGRLADIYGVDNDLTNPHILYNASASAGVVFSATTFCLRGIKNWLEANPAAAPSNVPFAFKCTGTPSEHSSIMFTGCRIFSPDSDGGARFLSNNPAINPIQIVGSVLKNMALRASAFEGNYITIADSVIDFGVHSSVATFAGVTSVIYNGNINNCVIKIPDSVFSRMTNNVAPITSSAEMTGNAYVNFRGAVMGDQNMSGSFSAAAGAESSTDTAAVSHNTGFKMLKLAINVPSTGVSGSGRFIIKVTSADSSRVFIQNATTWTNNTMFIVLFGFGMVLKGETLKVSLYQPGVNDVTASYTLTLTDM